MNETTTFNMKLPKSMKNEAQATFKAMGMDMATATRLFYTAVIQQQKLPFTPIANKDALEIIKEINDENSTVKEYSSSKEFGKNWIKDLDINESQSKKYKKKHYDLSKVNHIVQLLQDDKIEELKLKHDNFWDTSAFISRTCYRSYNDDWLLFYSNKSDPEAILYLVALGDHNLIHHISEIYNN